MVRLVSQRQLKFILASAFSILSLVTGQKDYGISGARRLSRSAGASPQVDPVGRPWPLAAINHVLFNNYD